jgi:hypothetical protein
MTLHPSQRLLTHTEDELFEGGERLLKRALIELDLYGPRYQSLAGDIRAWLNKLDERNGVAPRVGPPPEVDEDAHPFDGRKDKAQASGVGTGNSRTARRGDGFRTRARA